MTEPAVRRNGTLQSCEPCRKSKIKCDHGRPVCGRCITKRITPRCFYHPAPMTRDSSSHGRPAKRPRTETGSEANILSPVSVSAMEPPSVTPGYLGSTSFSAVLSENRTDITFEEDRSLARGVFFESNDRFRSQSGLEVLKFLHQSPICDTLIRKFYASHLMAAVSNIVIEAILQSIRRVFDGLDHSKDLEPQLQALVNQIFRNTARLLTSHSEMTVDEYCASFTDKNLRWEAIGIILATAGIAMSATSENDADLIQVAPDSRAVKMLQTQLVEASSICLGYCDTSSSVSELLGFCQYNDLLLRTQYYGDTSYVAWRRLGHLTATVFAAGLHQENTRAQDCPLFLQQWRKNCFATAFYADKCMSTFVGRPPFINYRYCSVSPPLDLSDEDLIAGGEHLRKAISNLDAAGWNPTGTNNRVSIMRLRFLLSLLREQALEIALGTFDEVDVLLKYNKVIQTARETWEACPARLRYDSPQPNNKEDPSLSLTFAKRHIYLDYMHTLFIIQRMIVKRTATGHAALFTTSREILSIILSITGERDPLAMDISRHHSWVMLYFGLPSASILAFELLRQTQDGSHPAVHLPLLPRAEVIRNLSVFVSCLGWVAKPGQGNWSTCRAVEKMLSEVLDRVLDPNPNPDPNPARLVGADDPDVAGNANVNGNWGLDLGGAQGILESAALDYTGTGLYNLLNWYSAENFEMEPFDFAEGAKEGFPF
ncbi:hypothetical protein BJX99DRAFT_245031 [Aspergillus californicus]